MTLLSPHPIVARIAKAAGGQARHRRGSARLGRLTFHYEVWSGRDQDWLIVSIRAPSLLRFEVTKEQRLRTVFRPLGLTEEVKSGDASFDAEFFLACERGRVIFLSEENREAIRRIFAAGYESLTMDGRALAAAWRMPRGAEAFDPEIVLGIVPHLGTLAKSVRPYEPVSRWKEWRHRLGPSVVTPLLMAVASAAFAARSRYPPLDDWELAVASLPFGIGAAVVYAVVASRRFKGPAASRRGLHWNVGRVALICLWLGWCGGAVLNGFLDRGTPTQRTSEIVGWGRHIRGLYFVRVRTWRPGHRYEELWDNRPYDKAKLGRRVSVTTKPGFFGFEWIVAARMDD